MAPTAAQVDTWRLHRDICRDNGVPQSIVIHRQPENTVTPAANPRNAIMSMRSTVRDAAYVASWPQTAVWAVWRPQELKVGSRDAGDVDVARGWMQRAIGQCPTINDLGQPLALQDEDWLIEPLTGDRMRVENPVADPSGSYWTFELWSQR